MNFLIPIEIRGLGTPDVESLPSYIHRLAHAHQVTVSTLLKRIAAWYQSNNKSSIIKLSRIGSAGDISVYVRPNQGTHDLITILSEAVGHKQLSGTTFISIKEVLVRTASVFSKRIRWCPDCMRIFKAREDGGYFKLIWSVDAITHCLEHKTKLVEKCPVCRHYQGGYGYKNEPGYCQKCGTSLSQTNWEDFHQSSSWNSQGSDMLELVEYISKHPNIIFPENSVQKIISNEFDKAWSANTEDELWKIIPRNECIGITEGQIPITLKRARVVAYKFGVSLVDLLLGDISNNTAMLDSSWFSELPVDIQPILKKTHHNRDAILEEVHGLMRALRNNRRPLRWYASIVGVSTGYLDYHFSVLSDRIIAAHTIWKEEEKQRKKHEAYDEALKLITHHKGNPAEFSKKRALRKIRHKTDLPKEVVRKAINDVHSLVLEGKISCFQKNYAA